MFACDVEPVQNNDAPDDEFRSGTTPFSAEELYLALRDLSDDYPLPQDSQVIEMGTFDPQSGTFDGLEGTPGYFDTYFKEWVPAIPAYAGISAIRAVLRFRVAGNAGATIDVNGQFHYKPSGSEYIDIDVGLNTAVDWEIRSNNRTHEDSLSIGRSGVDGLGAFQVEAWPVGLLYEPPTNADATNAASFTRLTQRSSSTSIGQSRDTAKFVAVPDMVNRVHALADKAPQNHPIGVFVSHIDDLIGTVHTKVTSGSSVSQDSTLEITTSEMLSVNTTADLGPGRGDVIVYLRNPRLAWTMLDGRVTVTLIDFEGTEYRSVSQLRADLLARRKGGQAAYTGLSETTLEGLLELDPFFEGEGADLSSPRFEFNQTITVGGSAVTVDLSHTRTQTDVTTNTTFTGKIVDTQAGWLSVIGIGFGTTGQETTKVTQSSSRSVSTGESTSARFTLGARGDESYTVEAYYDRVFGTFALRRPDACPFFDPLHRDGSFCNDPACPCEDGAGDCDTDDQCADGLICGHDIGAVYGLPDSWDVCVAEVTCPVYNPNLPNGSFCTEACPCDDGEGDCDTDAQCGNGTFCAHDVGPQYGLPANWDVCVAELECPEFDASSPDAEFCSATCPCSAGEGDCDTDDECAGFLVCAQDVGANYGLEAHWDVCQSPFVVPTVPTLPRLPAFPG